MHPVNVVYKLGDFQVESNTDDLSGLSQNYELVKWEPLVYKIVPDNIQFETSGFVKNWIFHFPRLLTRGSTYSVYSLMWNNEVLCQCILTPASLRYQFMGPNDFQFGLVYTSPNHRNKKLANAMVKAVITELGNSHTYWWLTEVDNFASRKLAERVGFNLVGKAVRRSIMGFSYYTFAND